MKILITGGFGFIGSHLSESLVKNHQIILLSRSKRKWKNIEKIAKEVKIEYIDVTNFKKLEHCLKKHMPDIIIHLAGETSHSRSFENPLNDVDTNTKSTISILVTGYSINSNLFFYIFMVLPISHLFFYQINKFDLKDPIKCLKICIFGLRLE